MRPKAGMLFCMSGYTFRRTYFLEQKLPSLSSLHCLHLILRCTIVNLLHKCNDLLAIHLTLIT